MLGKTLFLYCKKISQHPIWNENNLKRKYNNFLMDIFFFNFIFKLYNIVLVLPNIEMNPPQVYMCSPSWTLLPPPSPYHPSASHWMHVPFLKATKYVLLLSVSIWESSSQLKADGNDMLYLSCLLSKNPFG